MCHVTQTIPYLAQTHPHNTTWTSSTPTMGQQQQFLSIALILPLYAHFVHHPLHLELHLPGNSPQRQQQQQKITPNGRVTIGSSSQRKRAAPKARQVPQYKTSQAAGPPNTLNRQMKGLRVPATQLLHARTTEKGTQPLPLPHSPPSAGSIVVLHSIEPPKLETPLRHHHIQHESGSIQCSLNPIS